MKTLYRSTENRVWKGVIGGLGEYLKIGSTALRLLFIILLVLTGLFPGVVLYVIAIFVMPVQNSSKNT